MRTLVTGSEGSLMQAVIPRLLSAGHTVVGVDNFSRYGVISRQRDYDFVEGDLCDDQFVNALVPGCDYIIQGAATIYGVGGFHRYPADILARDMRLHQNLLWAAKVAGVRKMVYISSSMVYERCESVPSEESEVDDMPTPRTDYGLSKLCGERLCRAFGAQYGLRYTIWRPFNIITPTERAEPEQGISHVFADFMRLIVQERRARIPILGDGQQVRCFTWIDDVAGGIAAHSFRAETDGEAFNLGNPEPVTMIELAERIRAAAEAQGIPVARAPLEFEHRPVYADDVRVRVPSVGKAEARLGWRPTLRLDGSLQRCVAEAARAGAAGAR